MKSYLGLVGAYAKAHRKKMHLTLSCIAIAVMLITTIFSLADVSVKAQIDDNIRQKGNYHAIFSGISDEEAAQIDARDDVAVAGWVGLTEDAAYQGKRLLVQGGDEDLAVAMNLTVLEGRYPKAAEEAMLDQQAMTQFGLSTGDVIDVTLADGQTRSYTITGSYNDFASLKSADNHGLYLSTEGIRALSFLRYQEYYYVQFGRGVNINRAVADIKSTYGLVDDQISVNMMLLGLMGQSDNSAMVQLYVTALVLAVLVALAGMFMIAGSFNMSVLERTQFFGLLRCLGATKKQVKRYICLEGVRYSLIGVPIGLLAGCTVTWLAILCLNLLNSQFLPPISALQVSWIGILGGAVVGLATVMLASRSPAQKAARVSPQAAVTGNINEANNHSIRRAAKTKRLHVDTAMGLNHALSNKKNMVLMAGSFAISIILFVSFTVFLTFIGHAVRPLAPYAPDIEIVSAEEGGLLSHTLFNEVASMPGIQRIYGRMHLEGIETGSGMTVSLISYEINQFAWAKQQQLAGNLREAVEGDGILLVYSEGMPWKIGDTITLCLPDGERDVPVVGTLSNSPFVMEKGVVGAVCSEETFTDLTGISEYSVIDLQVEEDISAQVRALLPADVRLLDKQDANRDARSTYYTLAVFVYGFLAVIALVALFNIVNTVNASVSSRMNYYGVMRAVGMSVGQLKRMITAEAAAYAITGSVVGCVLGIPLHRLLFHSLITSNWGEIWHAPLAVLVATVCVAIATTLIAVISPAKRIERMSVMGVVNAE